MEFGITERFDELVALIFSSLGLPIPETIVPENVTDELPNVYEDFSPAPAVEMTPRLSRALRRLTRYDRIIYDVAKSEFERRWDSLQLGLRRSCEAIGVMTNE